MNNLIFTLWYSSLSFESSFQVLEIWFLINRVLQKRPLCDIHGRWQEANIFGCWGICFGMFPLGIQPSWWKQLWPHGDDKDKTFCSPPYRFLSWEPALTARHISSVQFSCSVASDSSRPHESQHTRPPCPSPAPRIHSDSCPLSQWCHPAISSSVVPFSSCPPSLPASESFPMSQLFAWGGQSTGVSASASFARHMDEPKWTAKLSSVYPVIWHNG